MEKQYVVSANNIENGLETSLFDQQAKTEAVLEDCTLKQIFLNQHQLIMSAVKEAATDPALEDSVRDKVNRVLVNDAFVKIGSPDNFFSQSVIEMNAAAKLSYSESVLFKEKVEKILTKKCKEIIDKHNKIKGQPLTEFNAGDEKMKLILENQLELQKADQLLREEQELLSSLIEVRQKSIGDLQQAAVTLENQNRLLALKSKVEALTIQKDLWQKEDKDLPQAVAKLAVFWKRESDMSEAALKKAEKDMEEYSRLEKDESYMILLKAYQKVLEQTKHVESAIDLL